MYSDPVTRAILTEDNLKRIVSSMFLDEDSANLFNYIVQRYDGLSEFCFNVLCNCCPSFVTDDFSGTEVDIFSREIEMLMEREHVIHCSDTMVVDFNEGESIVEIEAVLHDIGFPYISEEISHKLMEVLYVFLSNVINMLVPIRSQYSKFCFVLLYNGLICLTTMG